MSKTSILLIMLLVVIAASAGTYIHLAPKGAPSVVYLMAKSLVITAWIMVALILAKMVLPRILRREQR